MQRFPHPQDILLFVRLQQQIAQAQCILDEQTWLGWRAPYALRCPTGHRFSASASVLLYRPIQCPECVQAALHAQLHQFIPRISQEVLVDFVEGDIDRPIVTGVVYNGSQCLAPSKSHNRVT
ncbi:hypothetical protein FAZ21_04205 [Chitiniphilus eburneus]|uniref:Gp5/Type VI secretion system Vgr protein OB-fold domain-containing protein n=1 Tax=Chitiniphilus eburneus TaxID=2571148 RepID=A0A4V5MRT2_9NEIS|nr:phage baseplate assembly protein V [Chitiniphilus eburneus]TJZ77538.1 hypothetical protein FAZ21_04205 [Chitiniphilus eburneus]